VKWALRILGVLLLLATLGITGAWLLFPWYAQGLLDHAVGQGISLKLRDPGRPAPSGMRFGRLDAIVATSPDSCTGIASTYLATIFNGRITWRRLPSAKNPAVGLTLEADSIEVLQKPAKILFRNAHPFITARLDISRNKDRSLDISPDSVAFAVNHGRIITGKLRLDGISYKALLTRSNKWVQQPSRFRAESLFSGEARTPLTGFEATFGMARNPEKPCTLTFSDCSVDLSGIRASTPTIEYSLRKKQTSFVLRLDSVPLERLAKLASPSSAYAVVSGNMNGSIPVEYLDNTLRVKNGMVDADAGSRIDFRGSGGNPLVSIDTGRRTGGPPLIAGLNAEVTLDAKDEKLSGIRLGGFSSKIFGGSLSASPAAYDMKTGTAECTFKLEKVPLLDRIRLQGQFTGKLKGAVSGRVPVSVSREGFAVRNARLSSSGGGTLHQITPSKAKPQASSFEQAGTEVIWDFSEPSIVLNRDTAGRTTIGFMLKTLLRRSGGGEMLLSGPKGTLGLFEDARKPSTLSLAGFSAALFDGTISVSHVDYDMQSKHAETMVQINGIPLQKLLDLQGTKNISATGTIRGRIPVVLNGESFSIPEGGLDAEKSGQIIYSSTPEERASANPGMKLTYEALGNFLYSELISSIVMSPEGDSRITLQLRGYNPDFQNGRQVNLNLNIEQNLLDLFRSLSISSGIEQAITEKALQKRKKR
jgi:hypothetical protein